MAVREGVLQILGRLKVLQMTNCDRVFHFSLVVSNYASHRSIAVTYHLQHRKLPIQNFETSPRIFISVEYGIFGE